MGDWETVPDGEKIDINNYQDYREYATITERDTASAGWGSAEIFRTCQVVETGYKYYWNGASWTRFPATGGAGAPTDASYVTINAEAGLSAETQHKNIAGANLHVTKAHASEHENAGADEINVAGLSGVLADGQNAAKIKGKNVDTPVAANTYPKYNGVDIGWVVLPGGGDMTKAVYDTDDDGQVNMAEDSLKLDGNTLATVRTHSPQGHKTSHEDGGSDEIDVAGLSGELAQAQPPKIHATDHENAGSDEISVAGLNGVLADEQDAGLIKGKTVDTTGLADNDFLQYDLASDQWKPETLPGGGDMLKADYDTNANSKVDVAEDSELLDGSTKAQVQTHAPQAHAASHQNAGSDEISVAGLSGLLADEQDAGLIKGVTVDNAGIGNDKALVYKSASGNIEYASAAGSGDMTKAVYDTNDDGVVEDSDKLEANTLAQVRNHTPAAHKDTHKTGGGDAFLTTDTLEAIAKTTIRKNTGANVGSRRRINFIEGSGVGLTVTDDAANEEVDVNISVSGGGTYKLAHSYTFYKVGSYYYAMDEDGTVDYSGTDWVTVFESAVNALIAAGGGTMHQRRGVYTVNSRADVTAADLDDVSVRLTGEGGRATQWVAKNSLNTDMLKVLGTGADRTFSFEIDHVGFDGNKANNASGNGIVFVDVMRSHIHKCIIDDVKDSAIVLDTADIASYYNCIDHNQLRNMDGHGVLFLDTGSEITDYHWIHHNTIGRSSVGSTGNGVNIDAGDGCCWITDNAINHMGYSGVRVNTGVHTITNNGLDRNGRHGINCRSPYCSITNNKFFENSQSSNGTYHSIYLDDGAKHIMITGNQGWAFSTPKPGYFYYESDSGTNYPNYVVCNRMSGWVTAYKRQQGGSTSEFEHNYTNTS